MNITVHNEAANWYKQEMHLQEGDTIRFFVQYGGCSTVQSGLSLGLRKDDAIRPIVKTTSEGIVFFVESDDAWYFDNHNLIVTYDEQVGEPQFVYEKEQS